VVRWTAPSSGIYRISGRFIGLDSIGPTSTDVHVRYNSKSPLFDGNITNFAVPVSFFLQINVKSAGDTIDFAVGFGADGNYSRDSTGFKMYHHQGPVMVFVGQRLTNPKDALT
jgi:hypothetical protein